MTNGEVYGEQFPSECAVSHFARLEMTAAPAAWSDASTTSDKAAPSWGWLNSVALASASFTSSKALTASSDSLSLLCELCKDRCQQRGSSRYEAAIEIHTTEELAEFVHGRRLTESAYRFDFFCQRFDALAADLEPEELKVRREENAFCRVQLDAVLFKPVKKSSENIFFRHRDLLIGADQVNFGEDRPAAQLRDEVVDVGDRVSVGLRHVVEASIISTWEPGVRLFLWNHVER
ncbi:hypothetical protein T01_6364 [Trichinella spiralis]|uniref:Uncharacterized protein n=1 Tax=Trichinella spiralis TaxID=6334 RepID=A0A0V1BCK8_TRISP|nr:hypothetical protein T01_6364 [Trichinella spiralis]